MRIGCQQAKKLKEFLGVICLDFWRYEKALKGDARQKVWIGMRNRTEEIEYSPDGSGVQCNWRWTSQLHAPNYVPAWGRRLMKRALESYPITVEGPEKQPPVTQSPNVTFIIGHRGLERLPLLLLTLRSIANQRGVSWECIVVEESYHREIEGKLPEWVKYVHLRTESEKQPYNRSRTFNKGAALANGELLVFHDNDLLVPETYSSESYIRMKKGAQVCNLKRFIFYLTEEHTREVIETQKVSKRVPDFILQNATGGGSLAVEKNSFFNIGGFDEGFVGWGGEDVEFWDRALTLNIYNYGHLPLVHLWHAPQPEKNAVKDTPAMTRLEKQLLVDRNCRITHLRESLAKSSN